MIDVELYLEDLCGISLHVPDWGSQGLVHSWDFGSLFIPTPKKKGGATKSGLQRYYYTASSVVLYLTILDDHLKWMIITPARIYRKNKWNICTVSSFLCFT